MNVRVSLNFSKLHGIGSPRRRLEACDYSKIPSYTIRFDFGKLLKSSKKSNSNIYVGELIYCWLHLSEYYASLYNTFAWVTWDDTCPMYDDYEL